MVPVQQTQPESLCDLFAPMSRTSCRRGPRRKKKHKKEKDEDESFVLAGDYANLIVGVKDYPLPAQWETMQSAAACTSFTSSIAHNEARAVKIETFFKARFEKYKLTKPSFKFPVFKCGGNLLPQELIFTDITLRRLAAKEYLSDAFVRYFHVALTPLIPCVAHVPCLVPRRYSARWLTQGNPLMHVVNPLAWQSLVDYDTYTVRKDKLDMLDDEKKSWFFLPENFLERGMTALVPVNNPVNCHWSLLAFTGFWISDNKLSERVACDWYAWNSVAWYRERDLPMMEVGVQVCERIFRRRYGSKLPPTPRQRRHVALDVMSP